MKIGIFILPIFAGAIIGVSAVANAGTTSDGSPPADRPASVHQEKSKNPSRKSFLEWLGLRRSQAPIVATEKRPVDPSSYMLFPDEIKVEVLKYLTSPELENASCVSRDMYRVAKDKEVQRSGLQNWLASMGIKRVPITGGRFTMGTPPGEEGREFWEEAPHEVEVAPFAAMDTHVTRAQWLEVMGKKPALKSCWNISEWNAVESLSLPANGITAKEADLYVKRLQIKLAGIDAAGVESLTKKREQGTLTKQDEDQLQKFEQAKAAKLWPRMITSKEAEYLARRDEKGEIKGDPYPVPREQLGEYAVYSENSGGHVRPVKSKKALAGIYDARGNVYTWTSDLYNAGPGRVIRGGSFASGAGCLRSGYRDYDHPSDCGAYVGVRLVFE